MFTQLAFQSVMAVSRWPYRLSRLLGRDRGQAMVEYAVILVLIGVVVMVVLMVLGNQVRNVFCNITGTLGPLGSHGPG
jgi:pilus assembly protein Flp/PilA